MKPIIEISQLNHYYGSEQLQKQVLFNINLTIYQGEIIILTGLSGSGKTTLVSLIGGLRSVQEGSLMVLGTQLYKAKEGTLLKIRRHIGYIFQNHNLMPFMTARENVQIALELQKVSSRKAGRFHSPFKRSLERRINHKIFPPTFLNFPLDKLEIFKIDNFNDY